MFLTAWHFLSQPNYTGAAEPVLTLCRDLSALGVGVELFADTRRAGDLAEVAARRFKVGVRQDLVMSVKSGPVEVLSDLARLKSMLRDFQGGKLVLHAHSSHAHALCRLAVSKVMARKNVVLVRHLHTPGAAGPGLLKGWLWKGRTTAAVTASRELAALLAENHGLGGHRVLLLQNTVDSDLFKPGGEGRAETRAGLGVGEHDFLVGTVARFRPGRGQDDLVRALARLWEIEGEATSLIKLLLVGRGEEIDRVRGLCSELGVQDRVIMPGFVEQQDLPRVYRAMDAFVLVREGSDAGCRAVLEAMACGLPVVGTRRAAMADLVRHGETGFLVEPGDMRGLVSAVKELAATPQLAGSMGEAGRRTVEQEFGGRSRARRCLEFYESLFPG